MKALKRNKDFVQVFRVDPETVIRHRKAPLGCLFLRRDMDGWWLASPAVFNPIPDQVLKEYRERDFLSHDGWQGVVVYGRAAFFNGNMKRLVRSLENKIGVYRNTFFEPAFIHRPILT